MIKGTTTSRILSIDAIRGITILTMIFVNELAGVKNIPIWMKHMPADADAMTFVDVVFPGFLFIVGMSIPFAIANRKAKGDNMLQLQGHIIFRTIGLLVLGVFMVNAESANEGAMKIPLSLWSLLFFTSAILIWNIYSFKNKAITYLLRSLGIAGLIVLAILYRGGEDGAELLQPRWWGILGLIGWAYFIACCIFQIVKGNILALILAIALGTAYFMLGKNLWIQEQVFSWIFSQGGHATHTVIVLCGVVLSQVFFRSNQVSVVRKFVEALSFATVLFLAGYFLRPLYTISKIYATPTWGLYSATICCVLFAFLYWLIDLKKVSGWTKFFKPAASNPLLTYIIPSIIFSVMQLFDISWPSIFYNGVYGMIWSALFAIGVMASVTLLNKMKIRLQL